MARELPSVIRLHDETEALLKLKNEQERPRRSIEAQVNVCRSVLELGKLEGMSYIVLLNQLQCDDCERHGHGTGFYRHGDGMPGSIDGPNPNAKTPRYLSSVKAKLISHLGTKMHLEAKRLAAREHRMVSERKSCGINVGKEVLSNILEHSSDRAIERRIALEKAKGTNMGTKNHSRLIVPKLRSSMHAVLSQSFLLLLTTVDPVTMRPPPFTIMADKATIRRETGQMHGLIVMIAGVLVAIFLSTLRCAAIDGDGLAEVIIDCLCRGSPLSLDKSILIHSFTCFAADGQYQGAVQGHASGLQVLDHLVRKLSLKAGWCLSRWDGAHRGELAMNGVREAHPFYKEIAGLISGSYALYLYGKNYELLQAIATSLNSSLAAMHHVCTTRFMASEERVYSAFYHNLQAVIQALDQSNRATDADKLRHISFVTRLLGIIDLLRHVKAMSLQMQAVNVLPWEIQSHVKGFLDTMLDLSNDLKSARVDRTLPPTPKSNGARVPAFKLLTKHPEIRQAKFTMPTDTGGTNTIVICHSTAWHH